jgi:prephenate dehydrogenase
MGNIITVIGAAGKMGKWFFDYFNNIRDQRYHLEETLNVNMIEIEKIFLYDIKKIDYVSEYNDDKKNVISNDLLDSIRNSDIVIFCIPIKEIINLLNIYRVFFKQTAIIIEISSVKSPIHKILSALFLKTSITTLCIHPMFGPGASIASNNKILFVPVNKQRINFEIATLDNIFPYFEKITIEDPHKHDLAISVTISIIYFINIVFSKFLTELSDTKDFRFEENTTHFLRKVSGSSFKIQSLLSESILTDDLSLFQTLFTDNDTTLPLVQKYVFLFNKLLEGIEKKDNDFIKDFVQSTKADITKNIDINNSYNMLYKFLNFYYK